MPDVSAKNGTEAKDKRRLPFGIRARRGLEAFARIQFVRITRTSKRHSGTETIHEKTPEKALSNDGYKKLQREGLRTG
jgi:hypothetical protein